MAHGMESAKRPTTVLAGKYGHPLHPAVVPVAIGAWMASVVLDIASRLLGSPGSAATASHAAWWLLGLGVLGALAAAALGFLDLVAIPAGTRAWRVGVTHMSCNLTATVLFAIGWFLRRDDVAPAGGTSWGHLVLSLVGLALLGAGGYLGGELAYRYGVRVADEATQATGYVGPGSAGSGGGHRDAARSARSTTTSKES
jgi:uncharacterized membrane protein